MTAAVELPRIRKQVPDWHERAACRLFQNDLDWIEARRDSPQALACRIICAACPVRLQCVTSALERAEPWGIHGGLDRRDRTEVAAEYGFPRPSVLPEHGTNSRRVKHGCPCAECKAAHALYEAQRRARVRQRRLTAVDEVVEPERPCLRLDLSRHHRRYRRRVGRR